jgi:hypothetical protein
VKYYRNPTSNIIAVRKQFINQNISGKYGLVPDNHLNPNWYKIVIMEHVTIEKLALLVEDLRDFVMKKIQN